MTTPEGRIKAKLKKALDKELGEYHWRFMPVQTGYGADALDFLLCVNGKFVAIETKADEKKKLTPRQITTSENIEAAGGIVFVVYDERTLQMAISKLKKINNNTY